ncbi:hypothetical protein [Nonomuraea cavernae]|uniref:Uncharacterized protein n=1 Tax=Nonomuraea cavernae TaxID=2045107 RepID=A0A917YR44_9ACTN|nr:hypothetical protein [Nonomuraea cavernae]MCA2184030.1 hypothetical protein [Nonomuraea cavernae]GGO62107.1 hypothetical protein GCM10012289_05980 [Nonomuraea cavernae]
MLIPCLACESRFVPDEYFRACSDYNRGLDLVSWTCPRCGNRDDLRVLPGELGFGYPYRGRFAVYVRLRVPGLSRKRGDLRLDISLDAGRWRVPTRIRQCV